MADKPQSYANHTRLDPLFHMILAPIGLILVIGAIVNLVQQNFSWSADWHALAIVWAFLVMFKVRLYALKNQDRIIRLEERMRLKHLLPEALRPRIGELTESQLIGIRFASDGEVSGLVEKTLAGNWDQKHIKKEIKNWRPDNWRV